MHPLQLRQKIKLIRNASSLQPKIKYLNKLNLKLTTDEEAKLRKDLFDEFEKEFKLQTKTPNQLITIFIDKKFNINTILTPIDLGEEARNQIISWGLSKAKEIEKNK